MGLGTGQGKPLPQSVPLHPLVPGAHLILSPFLSWLKKKQKQTKQKTPKTKHRLDIKNKERKANKWQEEGDRSFLVYN